jgi:hypothetical protein
MTNILAQVPDGARIFDCLSRLAKVLPMTSVANL